MEELEYYLNYNNIFTLIAFLCLTSKMIEIPIIKARCPMQGTDLYAYSSTYTLLDINLCTSTWSRACKFIPSSLLSLPLLPSLCPLGQRRSTIDASSLPASAQIYGDIYAGRSYIRGFWRIAYIREILITWPRLTLPPRPAHIDTRTSYLRENARRASSGKGNTVPRYHQPMGLSFALYWRSVSLPSDLSIFRRPCLPVSPFATRNV